jgi:hypothetical protein
MAFYLNHACIIVLLFGLTNVSLCRLMMVDYVLLERLLSAVQEKIGQSG